MMRWLPILPLAAALPAAAQLPQTSPPPAALPSPVLQQPGPVVPPPLPGWTPAAAYITPGQDEAGYQRWYRAQAWRRDYINAFNAYLAQHGVAGVVPTWQLLRTATSWIRCGAQPFEIPPTTEWPNIVQTLRYIHDYVIPAVGPVEPVSAYRNPMLNACAGGAPESAHKHYSAIDMVPLNPISREELIRRLCRSHARRGDDYQVGLGFYSFMRFHVDTTRFRRWGASEASACPAIVRPVDIATVAPQVPEATAPTGATVVQPMSTQPPGTVSTSAPTTAPAASTTVPIVQPPAGSSPPIGPPAPAASAPATQPASPPSVPPSQPAPDPLAPAPQPGTDPLAPAPQPPGR